jgi:hypothetical protein
MRGWIAQRPVLLLVFLVSLALNGGEGGAAMSSAFLLPGLSAEPQPQRRSCRQRLGATHQRMIGDQVVALGLVAPGAVSLPQVGDHLIAMAVGAIQGQAAQVCLLVQRERSLQGLGLRGVGPATDRPGRLQQSPGRRLVAAQAAGDPFEVD